MLSAAQLKEYAKTLSIPVSGVCSAEKDEALRAQLLKRRGRTSVCEFEEADVELRCSLQALMPEARSVFVCLFPYHIHDLAPGNISCYAMVQDYHRVAGALLEQLADYIKAKEPSARCMALCDTGPQVDRRLAYRAGLGFYGKNQLLIHPVYGSYFFIGSLLLNLPLQEDSPMTLSCDGCDACIRACPGQALSDENGFDCGRCISYLTQKKTVTEAQQALLMAQNSVYGCDVCQRVCPHNRAVPDTPVSAFYEKPVQGLDETELQGMSGRAFKKKYGAYPFAWCSKQTILKNFKK